MRVLVLFGSQSDESVAARVTCELKRLGPDDSIDLCYLSAHRNPQQLHERLGKKDFDVVLAGAGLAAHLPGVVASLVSVPVLGIPIDAALGGMDALLAILQMPAGVPVLTVGVGGELEACHFVHRFKQLAGTGQVRPVSLVVSAVAKNYEYAGKVIDKIKNEALACNMEIIEKEKTQMDAPAIVLAATKRDVQLLTNDHLGPYIFVPLWDEHASKSPSKAFELYELVKSGGVWVGLNNGRNAVLGMHKITTAFQGGK